jgi:hypothetical protein
MDTKQWLCRPHIPAGRWPFPRHQGSMQVHSVFHTTTQSALGGSGANLVMTHYYIGNNRCNHHCCSLISSRLTVVTRAVSAALCTDSSMLWPLDAAWSPLSMPVGRSTALTVRQVLSYSLIKNRHRTSTPGRAKWLQSEAACGITGGAAATAGLTSASNPVVREDAGDWRLVASRRIPRRSSVLARPTSRAVHHRRCKANRHTENLVGLPVCVSRHVMSSSIYNAMTGTTLQSRGGREHPKARTNLVVIGSLASYLQDNYVLRNNSPLIVLLLAL